MTYLASQTTISAQARFLASAEYYAKVGATATKFVDSLYANPQVLGRAPDPVGAAHWVALLAGGDTPLAVATSFLDSPERQAKRVADDFHASLGRAPLSSETTGWSSAYARSGYNDLVLIGQLDSTGEFLSPFHMVG
jgi:hypothetical protein